MKGLFITGTDTDIGKTFITGCIAAACRKRGYKCGVYKPFASGGVRQDGKLVSEDALFLMHAGQIEASLYDEVNMVCLEPSLTPALAAEVSDVIIDIDNITTRLCKFAEKHDFVLIEGAGGITTPLWKNYLVSDFMMAMDLPALIVGHARLGTINHMVLTHDYGSSRGINMAGFIMNGAEKQDYLVNSNRSYIQALTKMSCLGFMPHLDFDSDSDLAGFGEEYLKIDKIINIVEGI